MLFIYSVLGIVELLGSLSTKYRWPRSFDFKIAISIHYTVGLETNEASAETTKFKKRNNWKFFFASNGEEAATSFKVCSNANFKEKCSACAHFKTNS